MMTYCKVLCTERARHAGAGKLPTAVYNDCRTKSRQNHTLVRTRWSSAGNDTRRGTRPLYTRHREDRRVLSTRLLNL